MNQQNEIENLAFVKRLEEILKKYNFTELRIQSICRRLLADIKRNKTAPHMVHIIPAFLDQIDEAYNQGKRDGIEAVKLEKREITHNWRNGLYSTALEDLEDLKRKLLSEEEK